MEDLKEKWPFSHHSKSGQRHPAITQSTIADGYLSVALHKLKISTYRYSILEELEERYLRLQMGIMLFHSPTPSRSSSPHWRLFSPIRKYPSLQSNVTIDPYLVRGGLTKRPFAGGLNIGGHSTTESSICGYSGTYRQFGNVKQWKLISGRRH